MVNINGLKPRARELLSDAIVSGSVEVTSTNDYRHILELRSFGLVQPDTERTPALAFWKPTAQGLTVSGNAK